MNDSLNYRRAAVMNGASWALIAVYIVYLKHHTIYRSYFDLVQGLTYRDRTPSAFDHVADTLHFFLPDLALIAAVLACHIALHRYTKRWLLIPVQILFSVSTIGLLYANQHSWGTVGQYLNYPSAMVALSFLFEAPDTAASYFETDSLLIIATLMALAVSFTLFNGWLSELKLLRPLVMPLFVTSSSLLAICLLLGSLSRMADYPISAGYMQASVLEIMPPPSAATDDSPGNELPTGDARVNFGNDRYSGSSLHGAPVEPASGNDLIVFVLETAAARFMQLDNDLDDYPALAELSDHSLTALQHYSTFPASSESIASIFSGAYPPRSFYQTCLMSNEGQRVDVMPGIVSDFSQNGAKTGLYQPYRPRVPLDMMWHEKSGFDSIFYTNHHQKVSDRANDEGALDKMKEDIGRWVDDDQRYATFFFPQLGHGPWEDRAPGTSVVEYGHELTRRQDAWVSELIELLRQKDTLDTTTIVVTGDHGIRTSAEDPDFVPGMINDYTFNVPLFVYSQQFKGRNFVTAPTSHVDLAPSLALLHGLGSNLNQYQGVALWEAGLVDRDIFFPANWYFGADGFYSDGFFYMWSSTLGLHFKSKDMNFQNVEILEDIESMERVRAKITLFNDIQQTRVDSLCQTALAVR